MSVYELRNVHRQFATESGRPVAAVAGVDLAIAAGERVALIGPSGAGKTTLLRLFNGLLSPSSGDLRFEGIALQGRSSRKMQSIRARIGAIHQVDSLVGQLSVLQNVLAGGCGQQGAWQILRTRLLPSEAEVHRARACLERVGLGDKWQEPTSALSGGQRQRAGLARVLYQDPDVILADEPVSALDPALAREVVELLVGQSGDRTLVVSLHAVDLALRYFPRIVGLREGRVSFDRPSDQITETMLTALFGPGPMHSHEPAPAPRSPAAPAWKPVI